MTDEDLALARQVPERGTTPEEEAAIVSLAEAALAEADCATDAAEMLCCATTLILVREMGPVAACAIFTHLAAVQRVAFERLVQ